jgi:hypothetical protein
MSYSTISEMPGMDTGTAAVADPTGGASADGISYAMQEQSLEYYASPFWGMFPQSTTYTILTFVIHVSL